MDLNKQCKNCQVQLTTENAAKKNAKYYRNECKPCRSNAVVKSMVGNPKRMAYANAYNRRTGKVKEYPCEGCSKLCYKKYEKAFCSDMCRFMHYVDKQEDCWIWIGHKNNNGYGIFGFKYKNSSIASRVSYELFKGPIEESKFICHTCDNPSCVNPDHLWAGTHVENMMDMTEKGRQSSKLTNVEVFKIRKLHEEGYSNSKLMELFNTSSCQISNIIHRRTWKHV